MSGVRWEAAEAAEAEAAAAARSGGRRAKNKNPT